MGKLLLIGASLLAFHGGSHHRYWWPPTEQCIVWEDNGIRGAVPGLRTLCTTTPAGWHSTPPPADTWQP